MHYCIPQNSRTEFGKLCRYAPSASDLAPVNGPNPARIERRNSQGLAVQGSELHFVSGSILVNHNNGSNIPVAKPHFWQIGSEHYKIQFFNHGSLSSNGYAVTK